MNSSTTPRASCLNTTFPDGYSATLVCRELLAYKRNL